MPLLSRFLLLLVLLPCSAFAAGRELGPRGGGQTAYSVSGNPHTAFAGDRFLTVWREQRGPIGTFLMGIFSNRNGRTIEELAFPLMPMHGEPQQLVSTVDGYALFWMDTEARLHLTHIDLNGKVTSTRMLAQSRILGMRAAWNGKYFLVALRGAGAGAEAVMLDRGGNVLRDHLVLDPQSSAFDIVADGEGFTVIDTAFTRLLAYRITNAGTVTETLIGNANWRAVATPNGDGSLLVVWSWSTPTTTEIYTAVLTREHAVRDTRLLTIFESWAARPRAVMRAGEEYVLVYDRILPSNSFVLESMRFGAGGVLATDRIHDAVGESSATSNGSRIFVAYSPSRELPFRIESAAVAPNGNANPAEVLSRARTRQTQPVIAAGGGRYLATWTDITGAAAYVRSASIGLDGEPVSGAIGGPAYHAGRELAWNSTEYLEVELRDDRVLARRLTFDGLAIDTDPIDLGSAKSNNWWTLGASAAWVGDRWAVTWRTYDELHYATVSRAGIASPARSLVVNSTLPQDHWRGFISATVAWNGTTALLVWTEEQRPPCTFFPPCASGTNHTFATRIAPNGDLRDATALALPSGLTLSLATSGDEFLLLGDRIATAIDASGTPRILASREVFNWPALGDVTWDGRSYAIALRYHGTRWHLSVLHVDRNANATGTARHTETLPPDQFLAPSIASLLPDSAVIAVQEGDAVDGARAVAYREIAMGPLPAPPSPPRNVRVSGNEVRWDAASGEAIELYRVEALTSDLRGWIFIADIAADQPLRATTTFTNVRVFAVNAGGASEPAESGTPKRRAARR